MRPHQPSAEPSPIPVPVSCERCWACRGWAHCKWCCRRTLSQAPLAGDEAMSTKPSPIPFEWLWALYLAALRHLQGMGLGSVCSTAPIPIFCEWCCAQHLGVLLTVAPSPVSPVLLVGDGVRLDARLVWPHPLQAALATLITGDGAALAEPSPNLYTIPIKILTIQIRKPWLIYALC